MFPTTLSQPQREGILDLLLLGMYADDSLRLSENERIYALLSPYGWESYQKAQDYSQVAIAHVRAAHDSEENTAEFLAGISLRLGDEDVKNLALGLLARLIEADDDATESEADFFQKAKAAFGV
jgi:hypothetical protein